MSNTRDVKRLLARWRTAGLIDEEQTRRILAYEAAEPTPESPAGEPALGVEQPVRPGALEAMVYLGLAVAIVGVITLTAQHWDDMRSWARIAVLAVPGVLSLLLGLGLRSAGNRPLVRAVGVAWLASVALFAGATAATGEAAGWHADDAALIVGAVATLLALALWVVHPSHPQMLALAGGLVTLAEAAAAHPDEYDVSVAGLLILLFGALGLALTERGLLLPTLSARAVSALGLVVGPYHASEPFDHDGPVWAEALVFVAAAVLVALSLRRSSFTYMLIAVAALFLGLVTSIFKHFEDEIGAPMALIVSGALLVAAALLLATVRGRLHAEEPA